MVIQMVNYNLNFVKEVNQNLIYDYLALFLFKIICFCLILLLCFCFIFVISYMLLLLYFKFMFYFFIRIILNIENKEKYDKIIIKIFIKIITIV